MENNFILLGGEIGKKMDFVREKTAFLFKTKETKPEVYKLHPFELEENHLNNLLFIDSFFSENKIIFFYDIDKLNQKTGSEIYNILIKFLKNPNENIFIFFMSEEVSKDKINKKIVEQIKPNNIKIFWELTEQNKKQWIIDFFKSQKITIENDAILALLNLIENNTEELKKICIQLSIFKGENTEISVTEVEEIIFHNKEESVFSLFKKIAEKELEQSIEILRNLLNNNTNLIAILAGILWQFKKLFEIHSQVKTNMTVDEALENCGIKYKNQKILMKTAFNNFPYEKTKRIIMLLIEADKKCRQDKPEINRINSDLILYNIIKTP